MIIAAPRVLSVSGRTINSGCNGDADAIVYARVRNGSRPYTYNWAPSGGSRDTARGLSAGAYTITVSDSCGNMATASVNITQPAALSIIPDSSPDTGSCQGSAWGIVSGGARPYAYSWQSGQTTDTITSQCIGSYCLKVTDRNGCKDSICVNVATTGIGSIKAQTSALTIYPNPSDGQFTVQMTDPTKGLDYDDIQVYNNLGEQIYPPYGMGPHFTVDLSAEPAGIYFVRVISTTGYLVGEGKLILQK